MMMQMVEKLEYPPIFEIHLQLSKSSLVIQHTHGESRPLIIIAASTNIGSDVGGKGESISDLTSSPI